MTQSKWKQRFSWGAVFLFLLIGGLAASNEDGCTSPEEPSSGEDCTLAFTISSQSECDQIASNSGCASGSWSGSITKRCDGKGCPANACPTN